MTPCCEQLKIAIELGVIYENNKFNEYGIPIPDGGTSRLNIQFCPWCGVCLPNSKRDEWFDNNK
jgi:hypothetical protein